MTILRVSTEQDLQTTQWRAKSLSSYPREWIPGLTFYLVTLFLSSLSPLENRKLACLVTQFLQYNCIFSGTFIIVVNRNVRTKKTWLGPLLAGLFLWEVEEIIWSMRSDMLPAWEASKVTAKFLLQDSANLSPLSCSYFVSCHYYIIISYILSCH